MTNPEENTMSTPSITYRRESADWHAEEAVVTVILPSGRESRFDLSGPTFAYGSQADPATVNWSALGVCSVEDTLAFAAALAFATGVAASLAPQRLVRILNGQPCPVHSVPEPCPTCTAYIAGGL